MRDLFLAFCLHPVYAFFFMAWIYFTVDTVFTFLLNMVTRYTETFQDKEENHEENRP